ncbi:hypothetical protein PROFUN_06715 [Planoprotostelium fungivorum]|uniref:DNA topoisomerase (ATP-hydrolyzing) n=1 Tax=Planoprotostelium fungivorum TaxID=1890364 RepID=A0A2P6NG51_9EUKA|nr:hypothetical protein PROFUN_06715 [Planoprotostelium fungivorum]
MSEEREQKAHFELLSTNSRDVLFEEETERLVARKEGKRRIEFNSFRSAKKFACNEEVITRAHSRPTTHRDTYYTWAGFFGNQKLTDSAVEDVAACLCVPRNSLNIYASRKGRVCGDVSFTDDGRLIDCSSFHKEGQTIPPNIEHIRDLKTNARYVLLIEKDATFIKMVSEGVHETCGCILVTGKGFPDVSTRLFLKRMEQMNLPIFGIMDFDPSGIQIMTVYSGGSRKMSYDSHLAVPSVRWLGIRSNDLTEHDVPKSALISITKHDKRMLENMLEWDILKNKPSWRYNIRITFGLRISYRNEVVWMLENGVKAEIQSLASISVSYLSQVWLPSKMKKMDWI